MDKAYNFLLNECNFNSNEFVVAAISGGPDSMTLLHLLQKIRLVKGINIVCAHVNHNKRIESDDEKVFVENYCNNNNIYFEYMKITDYGEGNFQSNARDIRYNFFREVMGKYNSHILLTAHHGDDLIETILMRIVRGSTLKGYSGFSKITDLNTYKIIRPLIFHTKDEIYEYLKNNNLSYVVDNSNNEDDYTRNRYRHTILPFLKSEDVNVHEKFLQFSEILLEYDNYYETNINKYYNNGVLDISEFNNEDILTKKKIISYILKDIYNDNLSLITNTHIDLIINLINNNKSNVMINLPNNIVAIKEYDKLSFKEASIEYDYNILLERVTLLPNGRYLKIVDNEEDNSNYVCRLSSNELSMPLYVRNRCDGDKMEIMNLSGSKKVKDIFIDEKVPISDRNLWPIVVDSSNAIVWIPGLKKSKYNKTKDEKCDIIIKYD